MKLLFALVFVACAAGCGGVPDISFVGDDGGTGAEGGGGDAGDAGDGGNHADASADAPTCTLLPGATACCGANSCSGDCSMQNCRACVNECGIDEVCCVRGNGNVTCGKTAGCH